MSRHMYSDEDVNRWLEMYNDGKTIEDISLDLGISPGTIGGRLRKHPDYVPRPAHGTSESWRHDSIEASRPGSKIPKVSFRNTRGHRRRSRGW